MVVEYQAQQISQKRLPVLGQEPGQQRDTKLPFIGEARTAA
jgi:hypothetical protein